MQQATGFKHVIAGHIVTMIVAFGIVVCCLTAVATLTITGDLPSRDDAGAVHIVASGVTSDASRAERRQVSMDRGDYLEWRTNQELGTPLASSATAAAERQLQMERDDFIAWRQLQHP
jgi:hypothetical protein